jgi:HK97 family phage prohead protease
MNAHTRPSLQHLVLDTVTTSAPGGAATAAEAEMVVSTPGRDAMGDRVFPEGVELSSFQRNPVLLWGHEANSLPIGTVTQLAVEPARGLRARWRWLVGDTFADRVKNAWDQGIVRAASIGFLPLESSPNKVGGYDHRRWELKEISLVAIPANAEATRQLKALGLTPVAGLDPDIIEAVRRGVVMGVQRAMRPRR